jgi:3-oxoacyl-[acyl-carrier protein] reductase
MTDMSGKTAIVVGASRGLGFGITTALAQADAHVIAVSRAVAAFPKPAGGSGTIEPEIADAGESTVPASLLDRYEPRAIILVAGAIPHMRPLQQQTWETFSVNWQADVRMAFNWLREALLKPPRAGPHANKRDRGSCAPTRKPSPRGESIVTPAAQSRDGRRRRWPRRGCGRRS